MGLLNKGFKPCLVIDLLEGKSYLENTRGRG